jgi:hypothetical protein
MRFVTNAEVTRSAKIIALDGFSRVSGPRDVES